MQYALIFYDLQLILAQMRVGGEGCEDECGKTCEGRVG